MSHAVTEISVARPDDAHVHLRDGAALQRTVTDAAAAFGRAVVMPNLKPPIVTVAAAAHYRDRILEATPGGADFDPRMTLYLTDDTPVAEIERAAGSDIVDAVKLYPAGATTGSASGVTSLARVRRCLEAMERSGLPLLVHGEVTDADVDVFDREAVFVDRILGPLVHEMPGLRVVLEHVTTSEGAAFVLEGPARVAATITAHHLLINRNAMLVGGIQPHHFCLPVPKRERHRLALVAAAIGDCERVFFGSDSAPHERATKEAACGCAGIYTAHAALELVVEAFEDAGALDAARIEAFTSSRAAAFYRWGPPGRRVTLRRMPGAIPESLPFGPGELVPFRAGGETRWSL